MNWLTLNEIAVARVLDVLEFNVVDFKNHAHGYWLTEIEQCANDTPLGDDIVFEIPARFTFDRRPNPIKLLRNCFTNEVLDEI
jgi:hypothetical protein